MKRKFIVDGIKQDTYVCLSSHVNVKWLSKGFSFAATVRKNLCLGSKET